MESFHIPHNHSQRLKPLLTHDSWFYMLINVTCALEAAGSTLNETDSLLGSICVNQQQIRSNHLTHHQDVDRCCVMEALRNKHESSLMSLYGLYRDGSIDQPDTVIGDIGNINIHGVQRIDHLDFHFSCGAAELIRLDVNVTLLTW